MGDRHFGFESFLRRRLPWRRLVVGRVATRPNAARGESASLPGAGGHVRRDTWIVTAFLTVFVGALSLVATETPRANESLQHLGGEYFNIARALVDGRGFSDPFAERTGPTAWMPPLYSFLLAAILGVVKTRALTASVVIFLRSASHVAIGLVIYRIARRRAACIPAWVAVAFYVVWLAVFIDWTFYLTHDVWLLASCTLGILIAIDRYDADGRTHSLAWGFGMGALLLASPVLASAAALAGGVALAIRRPGLRHWACAFGLAAAIGAPWAVRNRVVLHAYVPVKSNLYYDIYNANFSDDDGVWDQASMAAHPYASRAERFAYAKEGEIAYLARFREAFWKAMPSRWPEYARKVGNRLLAETVVYPPLLGDERGLHLFALRVIYPLPFVGSLLGLALPSRHRRFLTACAIFTGAYCGAYALVGFYVRYILPLTPILVITCFCGFDALVLQIAALRRGSRRVAGDRPDERLTSTPVEP
jgi:hypothetical protein